MLLLSLLVADAACYFFPPASYRLDDSQDAPRNYPRAVGFFVENGIDKFGIDLDGVYHTFDCTGEDLETYRSGKKVIEYNCRSDFVSVLESAYFRLTAHSGLLEKSYNITGMFLASNTKLLLSVNNELRDFSIEIDNGSSRKLFPRALYRLQDPKDVERGLPRELGFYRENNVDSIAIELNKFFYIYTCDGQRRFHYEDKTLINSYLCTSAQIIDAPSLMLSVDIRNPRAEFYTIGVVLGRTVRFHLNGITATYISKSKGVTNKPIEKKSKGSVVLGDIVYHPAGTDSYTGLLWPDTITTRTQNGTGVITFQNDGRTSTFYCDGKPHNSLAVPPYPRVDKQVSICSVTTTDQTSSFNLRIRRTVDGGSTYERAYIGKFSADRLEVELSQDRDPMIVIYKGIKKI